MCACCADFVRAQTPAPPTPAPTSGDLCAALGMKECKSFKVKQLWGCKWTKGECIAKTGFIQPTSFECDGDCCVLNKAACRGKTWKAKAWKKTHGRGGPTKACKFTLDQTFAMTTPDGKHFGACMTK